MSPLGATSGFAAHAIYLVAAIPLLVAIGVAFIVWRNARTERSARLLWVSLADPSPAVRRDALDGLSDDALAYNAPLLCELLAAEPDPDVLDALAAAVARSKWEPTADPSLLELRRWVAGGHARATRSSREPSPAADGGSAPRTAPPAPSTPLVEVGARGAAGRTDPLEPAVRAASRAAPTDGPSARELEELVPKVRAVLGDELERLELVSIDGRVLARWSSSSAPPPEHGAERIDG